MKEQILEAARRLIAVGAIPRKTTRKDFVGLRLRSQQPSSGGSLFAFAPPGRAPPRAFIFFLLTRPPCSTPDIA